MAQAWNTMIDEAQKEWGKLTNDQLQHVNGDRTQLASLLREHYGLAETEATKQIDDFYGRYDKSRPDAA